MADLVEKLAREAAELINGGEFYNGKWYSDGHRNAWRKAMMPAADEIERLRAALRLLLEYENHDASLVDGAALWDRVIASAYAALEGEAK